MDSILWRTFGGCSTNLSIGDSLTVRITFSDTHYVSNSYLFQYSWNSNSYFETSLPGWPKSVLGYELLSLAYLEIMSTKTFRRAPNDLQASLNLIKCIYSRQARCLASGNHVRKQVFKVGFMMIIPKGAQFKAYACNSWNSHSRPVCQTVDTVGQQTRCSFDVLANTVNTAQTNVCKHRSLISNGICLLSVAFFQCCLNLILSDCEHQSQSTTRNCIDIIRN